MTRPTRSPLEGIDRLLVDGSNLLHAIRRGPTPLPAAALIGRLRAAIPATIGIELVFDGPPEHGLRGERIASGLIVRHSGRRSGDQLLVDLVDQARLGTGPQGADNILVVTDDRDLRAQAQARGASTARSAWLIARLSRERLEAAAIGNRRSPRRIASAPGGSVAATGEDRDDDRHRWQPGRGATAKRGNPKRGHPPRA